MRSIPVVAALALAGACHAQSPIPIITAMDRFVVFQDGAFTDQEPRKPQVVFQNGDRLAYVSDGGDLKLVEGGQTTTLQRGETVELRGSRHLLAWKVGPSLRIPKGDGTETLCRNTGVFTVTDSLIIYNDRLNQTVSAYWNGQVVPVADVLMTDGDPQWQQAANLATFYDAAGRRLLLFYNGRTSVIAEGVSAPQVAVGCNVAAYIDDRDNSFHVMDKGERYDLEAFAPLSMKAGSGLVAYVTNTGSFKCYTGGNVYPLGDFTPSDYWVQDSVLVFLDQGQLKTFNGDRIDVIERYVPESWSICGSTIAYLDVNRQPRLYRRGVRTQVGHEAGVKQIDQYPGALVYRSNSGAAKVWWNGKLYEHY